MKHCILSVFAALFVLLPVMMSGGEPLLNSGFDQWKPSDGAVIIPRAGHAQDDVLQIKHPKADAPEQTWCSPIVSVVPGSVLKLSAWMKSNCVALDGISQRSDPTYNASLSVQFFDKNGKKLETEKPVLSVCHSVRRTWQYLTEPVIVPKNAATVQIVFQFRRQALGLAWASDIRLEKAEGAVSANPFGKNLRKPLLSGPDATGLLPFFLDSGKFTQIFEPGDKISFKVKYRTQLKNLKTELPEGAVLRYTVRDIDGRQIEQGSVPLTGSAKDSFELKGPEKIAPGVYHEIYAAIFSGAQLWAEDTISFGIIPTRQIDPKSEPEIFELMGLDELAIRMGVRRRYLIGGNPMDAKLKQAAALKKKYGVKFYTNGLIVTTSWMKKDDLKRSNHFFKTDEAAFRADLHKQLLRYKGIIDGVGLMGELLPKNVKAEDQVEIMRILKEEINKVDPNIEAAAGGYFYPDFDLLWEKGLAKYADLIMIHRFSDPSVTASELMKNQTDMKKRFKKYPGVWVDEAYTFGDAEQQVPQQYAAYLASGVKIGDWHLYNFVYKEHWKGKALSLRYRIRGNITLPEPALFSYNTMVGKLSGLEYLYTVPSLGKDGIICYVFRRKTTGKLLVTVWTTSDVSSRVLQIRTNGKVSVCDIRGREILLTPASGCVEIGVTPRLQYVEVNDPAAKFSCEKSSVFPESLTLVHGKTTQITAEIKSELSKGSTASMLLPEGWKYKGTGNPFFEVTPESSLAAEQTCFGELLLNRNGKPCGAYPVKLNVVPPVQIRITPVFSKKGNSLRIQFQNGGEAVRTSLQITHSFTQEHHPEIIRKEFFLAAGEISLNVPAWTTGLPDEYPVTVSLSNPKGTMICEKQEIISFCGIPRSKGAHSFTGEAHESFWKEVPVLTMDSEIWLDAHEMCTVGAVFAKTEQNDGTWKDKDAFSVRLQQCWDEKNYYVRAVVRDSLHINDYKDLMIWSGDALQFRIANASNKAALPSFCIALNKDGKPQVWRYRGNEFNSAGNVNQVPCRITRNDQKKETVYELVFPKKEIEPVSLYAGNQVKASFVFLNRVNRIGKDPMAMRLGYGIYGGGGTGDAVFYLIPSEK